MSRKETKPQLYRETEPATDIIRFPPKTPFISRRSDLQSDGQGFFAVGNEDAWEPMAISTAAKIPLDLETVSKIEKDVSDFWPSAEEIGQRLAERIRSEIDYRLQIGTLRKRGRIRQGLSQLWSAFHGFVSGRPAIDPGPYYTPLFVLPWIARKRQRAYQEQRLALLRERARQAPQP